MFVALRRPPGYEDVHAELVLEDAMAPGWPWELMRDDGAVVAALDRPEGYERTSAATIVREAVRPTWQAWAVAIDAPTGPSEPGSGR